MISRKGERRKEQVNDKSGGGSVCAVAADGGRACGSGRGGMDKPVLVGICGGERLRQRRSAHRMSRITRV